MKDTGLRQRDCTFHDLKISHSIAFPEFYWISRHGWFFYFLGLYSYV